MDTYVPASVIAANEMTDPRLSPELRRIVAGEGAIEEYTDGDFASPIPAAIIMPAAARTIREAITGPEVMPPSPRIVLISEARSLAALASWMGAPARAMLADPGDPAAAIMTATAGLMSRIPLVDGDGDRVVTTGGEAVHTAHPALAFRSRLQQLADELAGIPLATIAAQLDAAAPGAGCWRRAADIITITPAA